MTKATTKKFKEMILHIAQRSEQDPDFGAVKLNKILFYADFLAYAETGKSITGQEYVKLEFGPAPRGMPSALSDLLKEKAIAEQERHRFGYVQKRVLALREPDLERFSGREIAMVDDVIGALTGLNAKLASELSHRFVGWQAAEPGEKIPYSVVFVSSRPLTEEESRYALKVAAAHEA